MPNKLCSLIFKEKKYNFIKKNLKMQKEKKINIFINGKKK